VGDVKDIFPSGLGRPVKFLRFLVDPLPVSVKILPTLGADIAASTAILKATGVAGIREIVSGFRHNGGTPLRNRGNIRRLEGHNTARPPGSCVHSGSR
jgi:hypothetical protein